MLVKLTLLDSKTENHPMRGHNGSTITGFSADIPEMGHPMIVWHSHGNDSSYMRTTRVDKLTEFTNTETGRRYWLADTANSSYRVVELDKILSEEVA